MKAEIEIVRLNVNDIVTVSPNPCTEDNVTPCFDN